MPDTTHRPLCHRGPSAPQFSPRSLHGGFELFASSTGGGLPGPSCLRTCYDHIELAWGSRRRPHPLLAPPQAPANIDMCYIEVRWWCHNYVIIMDCNVTEQNLGTALCSCNNFSHWISWDTIIITNTPQTITMKVSIYSTKVTSTIIGDGP